MMNKPPPFKGPKYKDPYYNPCLGEGVYASWVWVSKVDIACGKSMRRQLWFGQGKDRS